MKIPVELIVSLSPTSHHPEFNSTDEETLFRISSSSHVREDKVVAFLLNIVIAF